MPLFKQRHEEPVTEEPPRKSNSFFNRNPTPPVNEPASPTRRTGLFGNRRRSLTPERSDTVNSRSSTSSDAHKRSRSIGSGHNNSGFMGMRGSKFKDPSIVNAHQKVKEAEAAEAAADRALVQARSMVREAREHVMHLEREADEEAKLAKEKQAQSKIASKNASNLGRHGI